MDSKETSTTVITRKSSFADRLQKEMDARKTESTNNNGLAALFAKLNPFAVPAK